MCSSDLVVYQSAKNHIAKPKKPQIIRSKGKKSNFFKDPWIKYPHPLTYCLLLKSPYDLTPVEKPEPGEEYLLFYVNLMTLDYLEAIVPGDFVLATKREDKIQTAMGDRNVSQQGFIYSRRAAADEGFKIREGCG